MANNFENSVQENVEVKTMVRKASELKSLDELNLPKRIFNCVKDTRPEELIFLVRTREKIAGIGEKLSKKLEAAVDQAGFIRHDFDPRSFGASALYRAVFGTSKNGKPYAHLWNFESNKAYENYVSLSQAQLDTIDQLLDTLTPREKTVIRLRFGLANGKRHLLEEMAPVLGCTCERIRQIEAKALRKLRYATRCDWLEAILLYSSTEECIEHISLIEKELSILYGQVYKLERERKNIKKYSPFMPDEDEPEQSMINLSSPIEVLDLSVRSHVCLRRAGIETIGDFVNHYSADPERWYEKIRNLGKKSAQEIIDKINASGLQDHIGNLS